MARTIADLLNDLKINHSIKADHPFLSFPLSLLDESHYSAVVTIMWLYGEKWIDPDMFPTQDQIMGQLSQEQATEFYNSIKAEVENIIATSPEERNPGRLRSVPSVSGLTASEISCFISQNPVHKLLSEKPNCNNELTFIKFWMNTGYVLGELQCTRDGAPISVSSRDHALLQQMRELVTKGKCKVVLSSSEPNLYLLEKRVEMTRKMYPENQLRTGRTLSSRTRTFFGTGEFILRRETPDESEHRKKFNELKGLIADETLKKSLSFETMDNIVTGHTFNFIAIAEFIQKYVINLKATPPSNLLEELVSITNDPGNFELIVERLAPLFFDLEHDNTYFSQIEQLDETISKLQNEVGSDELEQQWNQLQLKSYERFRELLVAKLPGEEIQLQSNSMCFS